MDALRDLAAGGFTAVPPDRLEELARQCTSHGVASGDARYIILAETLGGLVDWWVPTGAVPSALAVQIEGLLRDCLISVLEASTAQEGSRMAAGLRDSIEACELPSAEWEHRGYVRSGP